MNRVFMKTKKRLRINELVMDVLNMCIWKNQNNNIYKQNKRIKVNKKKGRIKTVFQVDKKYER